MLKNSRGYNCDSKKRSFSRRRAPLRFYTAKIQCGHEQFEISHRSGRRCAIPSVDNIGSAWALLYSDDKMSNRREFITLVGGVTLAWPLTAKGQQRIPVIGFLHVGTAGPLVGLVDAFRRGLEEAGYTEPQNVVIEFRWAEGDYGRIPALAAELVAIPAAVLVTGGGEATAFAAKAATSTIPIVCNVSTDPTKTGLVASLSRPGGNVTGINIFTSELATKRVGLLHDLVPTGSVFANLVNPNFPPTENIIEEVDKASQVLGLKALVLKAASKIEIETAFASIREKRIGALSCWF
jgi:putative tryptophan/tyrosine transport system substrate-binding protein